MHLLTLFGPPAVGKLTVAKLVCANSGYKLFHNHLTTDLALSLFEYGADEFFPLMADLRIRCFEAAARGGTRGLVFTCAFAFPEAEQFVVRMVDTMSVCGARCDFVRLICSDAELSKRVTSDERRQSRKISNLDRLSDTIDRYDIHNALRSRECFTIDTTELPPDLSSQRILEHFKMQG
jgi:hypothetical protein